MLTDHSWDTANSGGHTRSDVSRSTQREGSLELGDCAVQRAGYVDDNVRHLKRAELRHAPVRASEMQSDLKTLVMGKFKPLCGVRLS